MYMINDQEVVDAGISQKGLEDRLAAGSIFKADTLPELARLIGVNPDNLVRAVESFNRNVRSKTIDEFGREVYDSAIDVGPFWASGQQRPMLHHTMGGVRIDTSTRVLNESNRPIPGLYAAGEVCGGIHGANRLGGNAVPDVFVFGRIAAESAAAQK
jgi:fumarate reductase flavoprotein subunit